MYRQSEEIVLWGIVTLRFFDLDAPNDFFNAYICLWALQPHDLACNNIKHLVGWIRVGNWASQRNTGAGSSLLELARAPRAGIQ